MVPNKISMLMGAGVLAALTSCASLINGAKTCQCTLNGGECTCCQNGTCKPKVVVEGAPAAAAQQSSSVDKSKLAALLNQDYSIVHYDVPKAYVPQRIVWVDDTIRDNADQLQAQLASGGGKLMPKSAAFANNRNDVFFYYTRDNSGAISPLRLCVQYYADDPLQYDKLIFNIDGFEYTFTPKNVKRGKGSGVMIWENSDDPLTAADRDLVYALAHSKQWVQFKLHGRGNMNHVKMLTDQQKKDFYNVLTLYRLHGGTF
ncbi:MAG: hypothetical protein IJU62_03470 [Muribaculaceae bacterium]|nr:hypothetical protein [Muribaculaceae bacterium]